MKYLVLLLIVLGVLSWIRLQRRNDASSGAASKPLTPQDMLPCAHCGVHVPRHDAIEGPRGFYCSVEHRRQHEG